MKKKIYNSLGVMSGTSMDGVDISIIETDGISHFKTVYDKYYEFSEILYEKLIELRNKIKIKQDLDTHRIEVKNVNRDFTIFHAKLIKKIISETEIDVVGFHGQTIFHSPKDKISLQLGEGELLSQLIRKRVVYNFRKNDLENNGQGAPLTPIFHNLISKRIISKNLDKDISINLLNIGGITNLTKIDKNFDENLMEGFDIGPGNCLIDKWVRRNSKLKFDNGGKIANSGTVNNLYLNQAQDNFEIKDYYKSLDIEDFEISFLKGLDFADGCATVTEFTANLIATALNNLKKDFDNEIDLFIFCGGGRKNNHLINRIKKNMNKKKSFIFKNIDEYGLDGDFIESQAFAYLAIRSILKLPISFPKTTRIKIPISGGVIADNF